MSPLSVFTRRAGATRARRGVTFSQGHEGQGSLWRSGAQTEGVAHGWSLSHPALLKEKTNSFSRRGEFTSPLGTPLPRFCRTHMLTLRAFTAVTGSLKGEDLLKPALGIGGGHGVQGLA